MEEIFTDAIDIIYLAKQNDIDIILNGDQLQLKIPKDKIVDKNLLEQIKARKKLIIDFLSNSNWKSTIVSDSNYEIPSFNRDLVKLIPLSFSQERLWFIDCLEGSAQYHIPAVLRLRGSLDRDALENTLRTIINRHEVLRTVILEQEGQGYQHIIPAESWSLGIIEESGYKGGTAGLSTLIASLISTPFDLAGDYMLRANLIKLDQEDHVLIVTMHHIASDLWSRSVLIKEVIALYEGYMSNRLVDLPSLQIQYADYAVWQRNYMQGEVLENKLDYWRTKLEGVAPLHLPTDYARPAIQSSRGAMCSFKIEQGLSAELLDLSRQQGATLYMTLLAAFKVLLSRYSGQEDICVGTPVSGRNQQELEGLIGFFINTLALRSQVRKDMAFSELLEEVKETTLGAYEHQEVPFEKVVDAVVKERNMSRNPLFQVLFSFQNTPGAPALKLGELSLSTEGQEHSTTQFDLSFLIRETSTGINGTVEYATDLYMGETIERMINHYINLLGSIVASPENEVGRLSMLSIKEEKTLADFNATGAEYPKEKSLVDLFEEQVIKDPEAVALIFEDMELSYAELNARSNQLAHYLQKQGVKAEMLVPICVERSLEMVVGILGILKAGGAYVPVDPAYPEDRISYMLEDTGASIILSNKKSSDHLQGTSALVIELDRDWKLIEKEKSNSLQSVINPEQLAYVIYTSGSTGKPKGVMIEHQSLVNYLSNSKTSYINESGVNSGSFIHLSYTFDASLTGLFMPLLSGKYIVLGSGDSLEVFTDRNLEKYAPYDFIKITPSHLGLLPTTFKSAGGSWLTGKLVIGGEALRLSQFDPLINSGINAEIINEYGPTEATVGCSTYSFYTLGEHEFTQNEVPIGKPIANAQIYILSNNKELSPIGVAGELYIGGDGLARGYLNRPELTAEKFIKDQFSQEPGARLYKTGDLGRWLPDGNIEYMGRIDDQVKIRGYRIELGEIESVLNGCEHVSQAVVLAKEDSSGNKRLIGYVVPKEEFNKQDIEDYLNTKLPEYMVPAQWVELESIPLTPNGKVDRKALPDPELADRTDEYAAPQNETEEKLAEIWQEMLEVDRVGIHDDFFDIGGHSLLAISLVSIIRKVFGLELPINDVFDYPTVSLLAGRLAEEPSGELLPPVMAITLRPEHIPLSFSQERLWFLDRLEGSLQYHLPAVLRLKGELNKEALEQTLQTIINRHEVLRTVIREQEGQGYQQILPADNWSLGITEELVVGETRLSTYITELISKPFDLSGDYMLRADLVMLNQDEHILVVTMHHIASDGWSRSILVKEVVKLYERYANHEETNLPSLVVQYADYAIWQRNYLQGEVLDNKLGYWKEKLTGVSPLQLPADYARPSIQSSRGTTSSFKIEHGLSAALAGLSRGHGATLYMTLLSAFKVLLYRYSGQEDICVGTPVAGRNQQELEGLIGFFINTLALRSQVSGDMSFTTLLAEVKRTTLEAYGHQEVPFEKVVDAVVKERDMSRNPLFQVLFSLQNTPVVPELKLGELSLSLENQGHTTSKFDLAFMIVETNSGIQGIVEYSTDLYKEETIERLISHYLNLLESIIALPENQVSRLDMLSSTEEETLLTGFNATDAAYPKDKNIVTLFEEQVARNPDAIALAFGQDRLTYNELNERSNQLAHYLQKQVKAETLVPVCIERSINLVVGVLGIMKAGGAYVPVDPSYPEDRISYMLEDTGASIVLSNKENSDRLQGTSASVIALDEDWKLIEKEKSDNLQTIISPTQLAYVIYTSGSTGRPKGVMIEHRNLVNLTAWHNHEYEVAETSKATSMAGVGFDAFGWEIWPYLSAGASIFIVDDDTRLSAAALSALFIGQGISHCFISTAIVPDFMDASRHTAVALKYLLTGGDKLSALSLDGIGYTLVNNYGPTENTVVATSCFVSQEDKTPPIGKPISNTRIYILSCGEALSPVGVPGEICIGGASLARGYLNRPDLTAEKFISNPFGKEDTRLYRTGDLGRWLPDGNIEYMGRIDDQVKIRGYRIELGEIESVLNESEQVNQAVVLAKEDINGNKRLVGYVVPKEEFNKQEIQDYLSTKLPDYMVPAIWVELESIPLTPNGKIDRKALPNPELQSIVTEYVAPRNATEQALANIWQELLGLERVGIYDEFFELGGNSLLAMRVVSYIKRDLFVSIPIRTLFRFTTINDLSKYFDFKIQALGIKEESDTDGFDVFDL
jgi:amino acid adenylation domain-containing protein